jgi:hypothetical protein
MPDCESSPAKLTLPQKMPDMNEIHQLITLLKKYNGYGKFMRLEVYADGTMKAVYWSGILRLDAEGHIITA